MSFLPSCFTLCTLAAVIGVGRFSAFLVGGRWKGSFGTVIIDNAFQAGIIFFEKPVFLCKAVYFGIQTVNIIFMFDLFYMTYLLWKNHHKKEKNFSVFTITFYSVQPEG